MEPESSSDEESEEGHDRRDRSYDPLAWKSDSDDSFKFPKKRKKKVAILRRAKKKLCLDSQKKPQTLMTTEKLQVLKRKTCEGGGG